MTTTATEITGKIAAGPDLVFDAAGKGRAYLTIETEDASTWLVIVAGSKARVARETFSRGDRVCVKGASDMPRRTIATQGLTRHASKPANKRRPRLQDDDELTGLRRFLGARL